MIIKYIHKFIIIISIFLFYNCTEPFEIKTQDFKSVLVVESVITNQLKRQEVKLSKTFLLEESTETIENFAVVIVKDNQGNNYSFSQNTEGVYVSDIAFQATPNNLYTLEIITNDGKEYNSTPTSLSPTSQIDELYPELVNDSDLGEVIEIYVDSDNSNSGAEYFRYEYEETYKIVAPYTSPVELVLSNHDILPDNTVIYDIGFEDSDYEQETCFKTKTNSKIIQTSTNTLLDNIVSRFGIKKISTTSGTIRDRYSILVKQYIQNIEAYTFYKTMAELGNIESILSSNQPGFINGNMFSITNKAERVIGFFEVSSYSEKRIYFDFSDFNITQPDYLYNCTVLTLDYNDTLPSFFDGDPEERERLYSLITASNFQLVVNSNTPPLTPTSTIFEIVNPECGDCTSVASNIQPDFWED